MEFDVGDIVGDLRGCEDFRTGLAENDLDRCLVSYGDLSVVLLGKRSVDGLGAAAGAAAKVLNLVPEQEGEHLAGHVQARPRRCR